MISKIIGDANVFYYKAHTMVLHVDVLLFHCAINDLILPGVPPLICRLIVADKLAEGLVQFSFLLIECLIVLSCLGDQILLKNFLSVFNIIANLIKLE